MSNVKNYTEQGGETTVIGGTLEITSTGTLVVDAAATVEGVVSAPIVDALTSTSTTSALSANQGKVLSDAIAAKTAANQADSEATTVAGLVTDFNALLAKLIAAGLMAES
jgi:hypothetical protein